MCSSKCPSASRRSTHRRYPNRLFNRHEHKLLFVATATQPARTQTLVRCYHHCHEAHGSTHRYSLFHQNYPIVTRHPWQAGTLNKPSWDMLHVNKTQNLHFAAIGSVCSSRERPCIFQKHVVHETPKPSLGMRDYIVKRPVPAKYNRNTSKIKKTPR